MESDYHYSLMGFIESTKGILSGLYGDVKSSGEYKKNNWWHGFTISPLTNQPHRVFRVIFQFNLPEFPFYYKPSCTVKIFENGRNVQNLVEEPIKESTIKLPNLTTDTYMRTENENGRGFQIILNEESNTKKIAYLYDNLILHITNFSIL